MNLITNCFLVLFGICFLNNNKTEDPTPPKTSNHLFYIQRNLNKNTIVYDANFDDSGYLISHDPISVYWIRYEEAGQKMELRRIEKIFAYGVRCKAVEKNAKNYDVELVASSKKRISLIQSGPFKAKIHIIINNKLSQLDHMYIYADNSGFWPKVKYIELYGKDLNSGEDNYEKILN